MDDTNNEDDEEEISSADNDLVILKVGIYIWKEWMKKIWKKINFKNLSACCLNVNILNYWEISISIKPECSNLDKASSFAIIFTYNEKRIPFSSSKWIFDLTFWLIC